MMCKDVKFIFLFWLKKREFGYKFFSFEVRSFCGGLYFLLKVVYKWDLQKIVDFIYYGGIFNFDFFFDG